ncbi:MAG: gliding motility-associated C-terminal domain-containing protein [Bacteroidota bacterium]|nr:gliding motility-associated C-terminal domain-containing protein [Bacteroidota bacterium]
MRISKNIYSFLLLFFIISFEAFATHNRSGEITYEWLGANQYKIRVTTYTKYTGPSVDADRCEQMVYINTLNGVVLDSVLCLRTNGNNLCPANPSARDGVILDPGSNNFKKNEYDGIITLNSGASYIIYMFDPNRNGGILNIANSEQQPFALTDTLKTFNMPGLKVNSTPVLLNPPIDQACVGQPFIHNPNAYDVNGDSLSYSHSIIFGQFAQPVPGYIPAQQYGITIDPITGDFYWPNPTVQGEYNFGILITEWRKTADGDYVRVGSVLRDLQIEVVQCSNNPPQIVDIPDTCIVAGSSYSQVITATDPNNDQINLSASGGPFNLVTGAATFTYTPGAGTVNGQMTWNPPCSAVRNQPYLVTIKATDNPTGGQISLADYESFLIKIVSPPPLNLTVNPNGTGLVLNWNPPSICTQTTGNIIVAYHIYRKEGCHTFNPSPCETGVPSSLGYTKVGSVNAIGVTSINYSFTDNNNGAGLTPGIDYSYIVVAYFADGSNSLASTVVCGKLVRDVPLLTNVSVDTTDINSGQIFIRWTRPVIKTASIDGFDTIANPGPYEYKLFQSNGQPPSAPTTEIYSVSHTYFAQFISVADTTFQNTSLNTEANQFRYKVDLYSNGILKASSQSATSVWLKTTGLARRIQLDWSYQVPWTNDSSFVYKQNASGNYILIASVNTNTYTDTGLVNGKTYCYKVKTKGKYSDPTVLSPLYNWSQKSCTQPVDKEAPCQPTVSVSGDCNTQITQVTWVNGSASCSNDIVYYNLYYTPFLDSTFIKIDSFSSNVHSFTTDYASSIAGCYAVTAIDTFGNESAIVDKMCVDNCPEYELPNIITINGDSINDFFIPIKNKYVKDIDLKIYNRWGTLMFETTDPAINWDGKNKESKLPCVNGTYYYICDVHIIRYTGIETIKLKGFVQIISKE